MIQKRTRSERSIQADIDLLEVERGKVVERQNWSSTRAKESRIDALDERLKKLERERVDALLAGAR